MSDNFYRELDSLAEQIKIIDGNLKFNITIFLALLTLIIALIGWALTIITRYWVNKAIDSKIQDLKTNVKSSVLNEIKSQTYVQRLITYRRETGHVFQFDHLNDGSEPLIIIADNIVEKRFDIKVSNNKIMIVNIGAASEYTVFISNCKNVKLIAAGYRDLLEKNM